MFTAPMGIGILLWSVYLVLEYMGIKNKRYKPYVIFFSQLYVIVFLVLGILSYIVEFKIKMWCIDGYLVFALLAWAFLRTSIYQFKRI